MCCLGALAACLMRARTGVTRDGNTETPRCGAWTASQLSKAYSTGRLTPATVAENIIQCIHQSESMSWFIASDAQDIRRQAAESTQRSAISATSFVYRASYKIASMPHYKVLPQCLSVAGQSWTKSASVNPYRCHKSQLAPAASISAFHLCSAACILQEVQMIKLSQLAY